MQLKVKAPKISIVNGQNAKKSLVKVLGCSLDSCPDNN